MSGGPRRTPPELRGDLAHPARVYDAWLGGRNNYAVVEEPVAVLMVAMLHFVTNQHDPYAIVAAFREAIAPGSHLVMSHLSPDLLSPEVADAVFGTFARARIPAARRDRARIEAFFDGFEILPPGLVQVAGWRPGSDVPTRHRAAPMYAGVGRL